MRHRALVLDRLAMLLLGLTLLAAGVGAVAWRLGWLAAWQPGATLLPAQVTDVAGQGWWPWACSGAGVLLITGGLGLIAAHVPPGKVDVLLLPGSDARGSLTVDASSPVAAAAAELAAEAGVRSAHGTLLRERRGLVASVTAVVEPHADLEEITAATERVMTDLRTVLSRDDIRARVRLTVASHRRTLPRIS